MNHLSRNLLYFLKFVVWATIFVYGGQIATVLFRLFLTVFETKSEKPMALGIDFQKFYSYNPIHFFLFIFLFITILVLGILFFMNIAELIKQLLKRQSFSVNIYLLFLKLAKYSLAIGVISLMLKIYSEVIIPDKSILPTEYSEKSFLYASAIIYIFSQIFKKGYELQSENDLTI